MGRPRFVMSTVDYNVLSIFQMENDSGADFHLVNCGNSCLNKSKQKALMSRLMNLVVRNRAP